MNYEYQPITPTTYVTPLPAGNFHFVSAFDIYNPNGSIFKPMAYYKQKVFFNGNKIFEKTIYGAVIPNAAGDTNIYDQDLSGYKAILNSGEYRVEYEFGNSASDSNGGFVEDYPPLGKCSYTFRVVENRLPLKKWTVTDVINRLLDTCEPIRKGEKPRFRLNGMRKDGTIITEDNKQEGEEVGQAAQFDTVLCPQLSFTKNTLRECLNEVGKVIHGEMRLKPKKDEEGWYFEVYYDIYGSGRMSKISKHKPYDIAISHPVESFCSALDSPTENLINTLDPNGGSVSEPTGNGYKSVRAENLYVRVTEDNLIIQTLYPIYSVSKLEFIREDVGVPVDITAYLFESSEYARLSSYEDMYPQSKLYALRFTQGERNIDGLNFKRQRTSDVQTAFGDYSILAILKKATGNENFSIPLYQRMRFRVTYTPIYNTRVSQTKTYFKDVKYKADLFFNQSSNLVETKYYGENLKGAVSRIGNASKAISYKLYRTYAIPKVGDMFDEDYMLSGVAVSYMPTYIDCTIALTKHFNRISQFIGVPSERRYSEVSETQAVERNLLYREYVVIGSEETPDPDTRIGGNLMNLIAQTFISVVDSKPISCVAAWGSTYKGNKLPAVLLPVISSAFGNSISFSWQYADNYSAGEVVQYADGVTDGGFFSGYFQNNYTYTDVYGRIYYYDFDLQVDGEMLSGMNYPALPESLIPDTASGYFSTVGQQPYILRKDSREALQVNVQVDFVTNLKDMIIGSALASYCPAVRGGNNGIAKLYIFPDRLDKFIDHVEGSAKVKLNQLPAQQINVTFFNGIDFKIISDPFVASGKSWAIVTNQKTTPSLVVDEKGNEFKQEEVTGGDVLIARNQEFTAGQDFEPVFFTRKREIFDKTVWKDRR